MTTSVQAPRGAGALSAGRPVLRGDDGAEERRGRAGLAVALLALVGVLFLAGFPVRDYVAQKRERREVAARIGSLAAENRVLADRQARLQTDEEIEHLARQHYNLVRPGEEAFAIIPRDPPPAPVTPAAAPRAELRGFWERALGGLTGIG